MNCARFSPPLPFYLVLIPADDGAAVDIALNQHPARADSPRARALRHCPAAMDDGLILPARRLHQRRQSAGKVGGGFKQFLQVEPVFANICVHKHMNRFTLRTKSKVDVQWMLYAMVHNIGKIATFGAW